MLTLNDQRVTVDRHSLIAALETSLEVHKASYAEALANYQASVEAYLQAALSRVSVGDFSDVVLKLTPPVNHEDKYLEIIEMMQASTDVSITLDKGSFKAYYRNEWSWTKGFHDTAMGYKSLIAGASASGIAALAS